MRPIPKKLRDEMDADIFYRKCCVTGRSDEKIEFHHNLIFAGRQVNEKWCILPLLKSVHDNIVKFKELCDWVMLSRATNEEIRRVSKAINYFRIRDILNKKFGNYKSE